jgi:hypothetical protein
MLFDLRGRGRRRTVQTVYIGLAVLFALGFVGLGVGGGFGGGGILTSLTGNEGSSSASFSNQIKKYRKLTEQQLADAQLHEAGGEAYVTRAGVTSKGKELYAQVANSWNRYLALSQAKPNPELAQRMLSVFDEEGLNQPAAAVQVLQIAVAARPTSVSLYAQLAQYAYKAHNPRVGDLASAKAVSLAPAAERLRLKTELAAAKKNPSGGETAIATTNGKTYTVKGTGNGSFTGAVPVTPSAPSGQSTTKKK